MTAPIDFVPMSQLLSLKGRTAVVTGAGRGIGAAVAYRLHEAGANVVLIDRNRASVELASEALPDTNRRLALGADVTDDDAVRECAEETIARFSAIDIWVNNAGVSPRVAAIDITRDQWNEVLNLNLRAAVVGAQCAARDMLRNGRGGVIVNMLSSCVHRVGGNPAHYRASKAGLLAMTQSLAVELGRHNVRVVGVAPTLIDTPRVADLRNEGFADGLDEFARRLPLRRIGTADEVAKTVLFAVSNMASFMTGCVLDVDGGETAK